MLKRELKKTIPIVYSDQAMMIIESLKDFDFEKFEAEVFNELVVGDRHIWEWLITKKRKEKEGK
jgi:hypothetical protein